MTPTYLLNLALCTSSIASFINIEASKCPLDLTLHLDSTTAEKARRRAAIAMAEVDTNNVRLRLDQN